MNHLLTIDKQKVMSNIEKCRGNKSVCLMVKANTYGLGIKPVEMLIQQGFDFFGVSTVEEALALRKLSSDINILIVSYLDVDDIETCITNNLIFTVYDFTLLEMIDSRARFHLKVDTNMGRLGFKLSELNQVKQIITLNNLSAEGIFSHLACASDSEKTTEAIANFQAALDVFSDYDFKYIHLYNSFGSLNYDTNFDNMVRIGIGIWGYLANEVEAQLSRVKLEPALSLNLTVSHRKNYTGPISYDHLDSVDGQVLTVPIGYHDGFTRKLRGYHIDGVGQVVGNVNMCQHLVLADSGVKLRRGDMYCLFSGEQLYDLCNYAQITTYEFLVSLSDRIKRKLV